MRAARLHAYGKPLTIDDVPRPTPGAGQVVVRVEGAGFCHSDLHVISGEIPILPRMPLTLGHENAGTVAAVGAGVRAVKEGDRVAVYGGWGDGFCDYCIAGDENLCVNAEWVGLSQHEGGYAEYLLVPHERYLVRLKTLDPRVAAPLTDAALTPYRAVTRALPHIKPDYPVLAGGSAHMTALRTARPEVAFSVSWWGNIRELREVLTLAETGRLTSIPLEFWPLDRINHVYERVKRGEVAGRAVMTP